jgi:hypothetical protein
MSEDSKEIKDQVYTVMKIVAKSPELQAEFAEHTKDEYYPDFSDWFRASYEWCKENKERILKNKIN